METGGKCNSVPSGHTSCIRRMQLMKLVELKISKIDSPVRR